MELLVVAEMCTIVTVLARRWTWCCGESAPHIVHLGLTISAWCKTLHVDQHFESTESLYQCGAPYWPFNYLEYISGQTRESL